MSLVNLQKDIVDFVTYEQGKNSAEQVTDLRNLLKTEVEGSDWSNQNIAAEVVATGWVYFETVGGVYFVTVGGASCPYLKTGVEIAAGVVLDSKDDVEQKVALCSLNWLANQK